MTADTDHPVLPPVWFLGAEELAATRTKLDKLQARATAKGFTGRIALSATPATRSHAAAGGLPVTVHGFDVTITGEPPRYAGWRFVAAVDAVGDSTVLRYPPGAEETVTNDQVRAGECDHCHTRRERHSTVLVAHEDTGEVLQVGRSCLKDFLGHNSLPVFLTLDDVVSDLDRGLAGTATAWDTDSVLTYAWAAIQAFGWAPTSAAEHGRTPTRDIVRLALVGGRGSEGLLQALGPHLAEARTQAGPMRQTLLTSLTGTTDYQANLFAILRADHVTAKHLGLAVSAVTAHQRLLADTHRANTREQAVATVEHAGVVGQKVTLTGIVTTAVRVAGYTPRSPDQVLLVVDCGTAVAKTTTAAAWAYPIKVGDQLTFTFTGTVKAHTEYHGIKQTVLCRPRQHEPQLEGDDPAPQPARADPIPAPAWETVPPVRLDGAHTAQRSTTVRTPPPGVAVSR